MDTNLFLFYFYLLIILFFLLILSYLISLELFSIFHCLSLKYRKLDLNEISETLFFLFISLYTKRRQWLICISMLEFFYLKKVFSLSIIANKLAYCYQKLSYLSIAEFYYLKALSYSPFNIVILNNLSNFYTESKDYYKAERINKYISSLDHK